MTRKGIISGTIVLKETAGLGAWEEEEVATSYGTARVFLSDGVAVIARHGTDPGAYILPHLIDHVSNLAALKALGVMEVLGVNSTGSLKKDIPPGTLAVPHDFIMLYPGPTSARAAAVHITPRLHGEVRERCLAAARACAIPVRDGGVYWQTPGPRLETKAEIAMMAAAADLVGMTMAAEAVVAGELGIPYASLCSVDNYAHGVGDEELTLEAIVAHARKNTERIVRIVAAYLRM